MIFYLQHWEEVIKKMATEQEVFKGEVFHIARSIGSKHFMLRLPVQKKVTLLIFFHVGQLSDILRLKQETGHMNTILTQLGSFVKSIASVTERLAPK